MKHLHRGQEMPLAGEDFDAEVREYRAYVTRPRHRPASPTAPPIPRSYTTRRVFQPRRALLLLFWLGAICWVAHLI